MSALTSAPFGRLPDGREVTLFTLTNAHGASVSLTDFGARVVRLLVPDRAGILGDVVLGCDSVAGYAGRGGCLGATCGRVANRIAGGAFSICGRQYRLHKNEGENTLHGGTRGFDQRLWRAEPAPDGVRFSLFSPDGDEGFPGNLTVTVTAAFSDNDALTLRYTAHADQATPVSLTNHAYWNLAGHNAGSVLSHTLRLAANAYLPVDSSLLPTGERRAVLNTPFDFTSSRALGERIRANDPQLRLAGGYDHCFALSSRDAAELWCPATHRKLTVATTLPGLQLYTANFLDEPNGKDGARYGAHAAVCLETQHFPNAVNEPLFPSPLIAPGKTAYYETVYRFSVD